MKTPKVLDAIADVVLRYRPKAKSAPTGAAMSGIVILGLIAAAAACAIYGHWVFALIFIVLIPCVEEVT